MKKSLIKFQIFSVVFSILLGTLLHFTYQWSNQSFFVSLISSVNESTWEHLKLLFFPMLFSTIIGYFLFCKNFENYICSKTIGIIFAILFLIVFFYTYTGVLGFNLAFLNIFSFIIAILFGEFLSYKLIISNFSANKFVCISVLLILLFCFILFTFFAPEIGLFRDPLM